MKRLLLDALDSYSILSSKKRRKSRFKFLVVHDLGHFLFGKTDTYAREKIWYTLIFLVCVLGIFFLFWSKLIALQLWQTSEYADLAFTNRTRFFSIPAERGVLYDRNGEVLVRNKPAFEIVMDTGGCLVGGSTSLCERVVRGVSSLVEVDTKTVYKELALRKPNIVLVSGLTKEELVGIEAQLKTFPNIGVVTSPVRDYLYGDLFAHLVGYVGAGDTLYPSIEGKSGVEEYYDSWLAGVSGHQIMQTDSTGLEFTNVTTKEALPGRSMILNVDLGFQKRAFVHLREAVEEGEAIAGAVVAQDPKTGGILALVSYPAFDPSDLVGGLSSAEWEVLNKDSRFPFFNRVISATYPPGSTFKVVPAAAALTEGLIGEHYQIFDPGYIQIGSYIFRNWKLDGHGDVDMRRALQVSNDTYFYTVGGGYGGVPGLGIDRLSAWAREFGFGSKTGIDLFGEASGFMPDGDYKDWYLGDTYITSIGQGDLLATPLQVNNMLSYFANGGYLLKPKVVKSILGGDELETEVLNQGFVRGNVYKVVREGLKMAVEPGGTGYPLFDFFTVHGVELAGKTGTSEYIDSTGEEKTHAWFTVFGPYEDANIVLTVFLEGGGSGSDDAAPVARKLLDYWFE